MLCREVRKVDDMTLTIKKLTILLDLHTYIGTKSYRTPSYVVKIIHSTNI